MPIRPPTSLAAPDRALALFTDRLGERRLFLRYLHAPTPPERMLFFHGDGGNGKSLLLRLLEARYCRRLNAAHWQRLEALTDDRALVERFDALAADPGETEPVACVYHDFDAPPSDQDDPRGDWTAPLMIRRELGQLGLKLPLFDFALMLFLHRTGRLSADGIRSLFPQEEADLAGSLYELIASPDIPFAGLAVKVLGLFAKHFKTDLALRWARRGLDAERLTAIQRMDPRTELRDALPRLLGESINAAMQEPDAPPRLVLLFDTHESFWGARRHQDSAHDSFERDEWLRALLAELYRPNHGVVVALAGREPPRWHEAGESPIPRDCLDTQLIGHLEPADARDYLRRALAPEPDSGAEPEDPSTAALREAMVRYTQIEPGQVHPLYLGLAADLVLRARLSGEALTADSFAPETAAHPDLGRALVVRLLRYCPPEVEDAVKALAAARQFDRPLYLGLGQGLHFNATASAFEGLVGFSFVRPSGQPGQGRYRIHSLLRRLLAELAPERTREAHAELEAIYRVRIEAEPAGSPEPIAEAIYHANRQDWERGYLEWIAVMDDALGNARYGLGEALAALRSEMRLDIYFARGSMAWRVGNLASVLSRHRVAETAYLEAIADFDRGLDQTPDDAGLYNDKGIAFIRLGDLRAGLSDHARAERAYHGAIAAYGEALRWAPDDAAAYTNKGTALQMLGDLRANLSDHVGAERTYHQAIAAYSEALRLDPNHVTAHMNKGNALVRLGELRANLSDHAGAERAYDESIAAYREALRRAPDHVAAHMNKGSALVRLGELRAGLSGHAGAEHAYDDAIAAYGEALRRAPDHVAAHMNKGSVLRMLGELRASLSDHAGAGRAYDDAIAAYGEALRRAPDYVDAHMNKGTALWMLGELRAALSDHAGAERTYDDAIAAYGEALRRAPDYVDAHMNKGSALVRLGELRAGLSDHAGAERAYDDAIAAYGEALRRAPDHVAAHGNQGIALCKLADLRIALYDDAAAETAYRDAIAATDAALSRAPNDVIALANKGGLLRKLSEIETKRAELSSACNRLRESRTLLARALSLAPGNHEIATELALVERLIESQCPPPG